MNINLLFISRRNLREYRKIVKFFVQTLNIVIGRKMEIQVIEKTNGRINTVIGTTIKERLSTENVVKI